MIPATVVRVEPLSQKYLKTVCRVQCIVLCEPYTVCKKVGLPFASICVFVAVAAVEFVLFFNVSFFVCLGDASDVII